MNTPGLLTADQARLVELLLAGHTQRSAAREIGRPESTVSAWVRDPAVADALNERRGERRSQAGALLDAAVPEAIATLIRVMKSEKAPAGARVAAAKEILDRAYATAIPTASTEMTPAEVADVLDTVPPAELLASLRRQGVDLRAVTE